MPPKKDEVDEYERAASAIWESEFLLIITGPSAYEDSSKTAFAHENCDPMLVQTQANKFFGFWGNYFNRYNERVTPETFHILKKWRDSYFDAWGLDVRKRQVPGRAKEGEEEEHILQKCYVVASSVDGSFHRVGFREDEIYELTGSVSNWQCWIPCKPQVWTVDPGFVFEIDVMKEAKPIKYVTDTRQDYEPEVWDIYDSDDDPEEPLPPIQKDAKGNLKQLTEYESHQQAKEKQQKYIKRLHRATATHLSPEVQEKPPNLNLFVDHLTPTPRSNHEQKIPFTFPVPKKNSESDEDEEKVDDKPPGPRQPYVLQPRINHTLAHVLGVYYNKAPYSEGVFEECDPDVEKAQRDKRWQDQQKFFEPSCPALSIKRKKHITYNVSVFIYDLHDPVPHPPFENTVAISELMTVEAEAPVVTADDMKLEPLPTLTKGPVQLNDIPFNQPNPNAPKRDKNGKVIFQPILPPADAASDKPRKSSRSPSLSTTREMPHSPGSPQAPLSTPGGLGADSKLGFAERTPSLYPAEVMFEPEPEPEQESFVQGKDGYYFFSHVELKSTHQDPDNIYYDTVRIPFPDSETVNLPRRGKISVVMECCIGPEPVEAPPPSKDKKKKKAPEPTIAITATDLDPIPEPNQYTACQLVGRFAATKSRVGGGSVVSAGESQSRFSKMDQSIKSEEDDKEDFEYRIATRKGHIMKIGATQTLRRGIKYIEVEVPVKDPGRNEILQGGTQRSLHVGTGLGSGTFGGSGAIAGGTPADAKLKSSKKKKPRPVPNHQLCAHCRDLARPNVVMDPKKDIRCIQPPKKPYGNWESAMLKKLKGGGTGNLTIIELGCEKKMDGARKCSERIYKMAKATQKAYHIRIATEDLSGGKKGGFGNEANTAIVIQENVMNALTHIDRCLMDMKRRK